MKLVFVYSTSQQFLSQATSFAKRIIRPDGGVCHLQKLTHGEEGVKEEWETFIDSLPHEAHFITNDDFQAAYLHNDEQLPAVFVADGLRVRELISAKQIEACTNLNQLIALVKQYTK